MNYKITYYHNEIELIRVENAVLKGKIEKEFLRNRISYYIRWDKPTFWQRFFGSRGAKNCRICINERDKEKALEILNEFDEKMAGQGELLLKRTEFILPDIYIHKH